MQALAKCFTSYYQIIHLNYYSQERRNNGEEKKIHLS